MSIGMFSIVPVPKQCWDERRLPWVIPWMPVVGGLIGLAWYAVACRTGDVPLPLRAAMVSLTPFVLSGFLHLDGLMDVADAHFSRRELEEKRRILKDPHVGAFAVMALACVFLFQFCAVETILAGGKPAAALVFIPIVSRCAAGLLLLSLKATSETGFAAMFKKDAGKRHVALIGGVMLLALAMAALFGLDVLIVSAVTAIAGSCILLRLAAEFRGVSGDLCGCAITLGELCGLLALASI